MNNRKLLSVSLTILIAVAMLALVAPAVTAQDQGSTSLADGELQQQDVQTDQAANPINITLEPSEVVSGPGGVNTYDIVVTGATGGIQGYDNVEIEIQDPSVAQFTNLTETKESDTSSSEIRDSNGNPASEGPVVYLEAALLGNTFEGAEEIILATAEIEATGDVNDGTSVEVLETASDGDAPAIQNTDGEEYPVDSLTGSDYEISFDMSLDFNNQDVQAGNTVTVESVESDGEDALVVITYQNDAGDLVVAGTRQGVFEGGDVAVTLSDTGGLEENQEGALVGDHTAHILPLSEVSDETLNTGIVSGATADAIIDAETATVTDPPIPDLTGLDIAITEGLTIGDDYPLNQREMIGAAGSIYGFETGDLPAGADAPDQRYAPIANGQHVGLSGLPVQTETYDWASDLLSFQNDNPSQTVAVSFPGGQAGTFELDFTEAAQHGLAVSDADLDEFENINLDPTEDVENNTDLTLDAANSTILIDYSSVDPSTSPTVQFSLTFDAADPVEGLDVDRPNAIDYETDHRVIGPNNNQERDNFVTFEVGATGISHTDTDNANNGFIGEAADEVNLGSIADLDGAVDGTANDGSFLVRQGQRVTFEAANLGDTVDIFNTDTDSNGNYTLGSQVDPDVIGFDDTAPGQIVNLNTNNLSTGTYFVTFGQDQNSAVVLDVRPLNLEATSDDNVPTSQVNEPFAIDVSSDDTTGSNVEARFVQQPVVEANDTSEVVHVERGTLTGSGDRTLEINPENDLNGAGTYTATVVHAESGVTTTTEFTVGVVADPAAPVEFADDVTIVSPSLDSPDEPGRFDRGDIIPVELELEGGNAATITFGNAENENVEVHATVFNTDYTPQDAENNVDTTATLYLSTYHIGHGYINENTTTDPTGYTSDDLDLTLNSPPYVTDAAANRNHGFFTEPSSDTELVPAARLDRSENVFAHGGIDIYGGSQSGAVLSSQVSYDFHAASDPSGLPYTLIGTDREEDRDDINFLDIGERSTENFRYWRAPGQGVNSLDNRLPQNITTADIESLVEEGIITPLETETVTETAEEDLTVGALGRFVPAGPGDTVAVEAGEEFERTVFNDQLAEDDFIIVQSEATGTEGVLLEAVLRNGLDVQEYVDTLLGDDPVDEEITAEFDAANNINLDIPKVGEPGYAANTILDYRFSIRETQASVDERFELTGPNVAEDEVNAVVPDTERGEVIADLNADQTPSTFYVPYQVTEDLPIPTGDTFAPDLEFRIQTVLDARGGAQANPVYESVDRSIALNDNAPLSSPATGASNVTDLNYVQGSVAFDDVHVNVGELRVPSQVYTISGTTTLAPGTEVNVRLLSDLDEATPFLKVQEGIVVEPQADSPLSTFEATFDFSETRDNVTIQGGTPFEADVLRTGGNIITGGDDVPGLVLEDPEVSTFEFNEQRSDGNAVSVTAYEANRVSQITILNEEGLEIGTSEVLPANELQEQFNIVLDEQIQSNQDVTAVAEFVEPDPAQVGGNPLAEETAGVLVEDQSEPFFSVGGLSPQVATVPVGTEVTVEATVENLGDQEGTQSVTLSAGDFSDSQELTLAGGASDTVSFTFNSDGLGAGEYTHTVSTDDDQAAGSLTVEAEPDPGVLAIVSDSLSPMDATVTQGDEVVVSVSLQNVGETEVTEDVTLEVSGLGEVGSQSVTLAPDATDSVSFTVGTGEVDAGDYTHTVSTAEDSVEGSLTIEEPAPADDSDNNTNETDDGGDGSGPGFGIAVAALALLGAALLAMRRRTE